MSKWSGIVDEITQDMVDAFCTGVSDAVESDSADDGDDILPEREWDTDWETMAYSAGCDIGFKLQDALEKKA